MNNELIIKNQYPLIQVNSNKTINDNELDKNIDVSTTKEEDSFIAEELIQYCSSPKGGLVSINNSCITNESCIPMPTDKNRIKNTVTMRIAFVKNEIDNTGIEALKKRSSSFSKKDEHRNNNIKHITIFHSNKIITSSNNNKISKCKSAYKDKSIKKSLEIDKVAIKKKMTKIKKIKKNRKSLEKSKERKENDKEKEKEKRRLSLDEAENKKKKKKKKKSKKHVINKKVKDVDEEETKKNEKNKEKIGRSSNIIILGFSSSDEESKDSDKRSNKKTSDISIICKDDINKNNINKEQFNKIEDDYFRKRQKTIIIKDCSKYLNFKKDSIIEKKVIIPKAKKSVYVSSKYEMSQANMILKPRKGKFTTNNIKEYINKQIDNKNANNTEKEKEKDTNIYSNFNNKNEEDNKPIKLRYSILTQNKPK